jgi:DNA-binding Lrp family transcriptional regulator
VTPPRLDNIDKALLDIIQRDFPLSREPFTALGLRLSISSGDALQRIERLKANGIVRLIGPVFNPGQLGYRTTLVAMKVPPESLGNAGKIIAVNPRVSHCYEREHNLNLWFTLAMPATQAVESEILKLNGRIGAELTVNLPAVKIFKIGAFFNLGTANAPAPDTYPDNYRRSNDSGLSSSDRAVINELQQDLPLTEQPFDAMSARLQIPVDNFLGVCQALLQRRVMRRFSASVSHGKLGFKANAMACWSVAAPATDTAGKEVARFMEVSHCYERLISDLWPYNLFAMIHADTQETCRAIADRISLKAGLDRNGAVLLYSTKEVKKTRVKYAV